MSQENVEIVRRCLEFWARRDYLLVTELLDPDVVFDLSRNVFNPDVHRGYDGLRRMVDAVDEMWDRFEIRAEELVDASDHVVAGVRISGVGHGSGVEVEMQFFQVWTLCEGKVLRMTGGFRDRAEALEAAGLEE